MATEQERTDKPTLVVPLIVDGREYFPDRTFEVISPATGQVSHLCGSVSTSDVDVTVKAAAKALESWRRTSPSTRRDIFLRAAELIEARRADLVGYMTSETGADLAWCHLNIDITVDMIKDTAGRIATVEGLFPATNNADTSAFVMQEPYGVVLSIAPWNAPYILGTRSVVMPLAMGNTVILKGSELSPRVMWAITSLFNDAGLPPGVLSMIAHEPSAAASVTSALIEHPSVKKINFTGSTAVGRILAKIAGQHLKPLVLELGGKAPAIVWEDADLDLAVQQCILGSFFNAGQVCMSTERIIVHTAVKDAFRDKLCHAIKEKFPSDDASLVLINNNAASKIDRLVENAVEKGANLLCGSPAQGESLSRPARLPVVVENITPEMDIYLTESFGPLVSLFYVDTEEEALRLANDTEYGLSSAVFTEDLRRGLRFARGLETGAVHINSMTIHDESALPHGGAKSSGYGRFNSSRGLDEWVRTKTVTFRN